MLRIGIARKHASTTADAGCRTVARFRAVVECAVNLHEHRVINIRSKCAFHGIRVNAMTICCELNPRADTRSHVLHAIDENLSLVDKCVVDVVLLLCQPRSEKCQPQQLPFIRSLWVKYQELFKIGG